jgi:hypothetical protein
MLGSQVQFLLLDFFFGSYLGANQGKQPFILDERKQSFNLYNYRDSKLPSNPAGWLLALDPYTSRPPYLSF